MLPDSARRVWVAAGALVFVAMTLSSGGKEVWEDAVSRELELLQGPQGVRTAMPEWDGMLAWATKSRAKKQGALQRLETKHSSRAAGVMPAASWPDPQSQALASRIRKAASSYGWLAPCSTRGQRGCLRQDGASLSAHSKSWLAPDISKFNLTLSSNENPSTPRKDQLPMGSSAKTWANIVQNKKDILFCTQYFQSSANRESCISRLTKHGLLAKDVDKSRAVLLQPAMHIAMR